MASIRFFDCLTMGANFNTYLCDFLHPPLTTVATPRSDLAQSVLDMLLASIEGKESTRERVLPATLLLHESTAVPR